MKKPLRIALIVAVALVVATFVKDVAVKITVESVAKMTTGLDLKTRSFSIGIIRPIVDIKGLRILNPRGYKDRQMLDMPETYVNYDLPAILGGDIHLRELRINLKEFTVVKNEKGELNLNSLKAVKAEQPSKGGATEGGKPPKIRIDKLRLKIGKVVYKDYSSGGAPSVKEFNINIDEQYENIRDAYSLVSIIVVRSLMNTNIANLSGFDLKGMQSSVSEAMGQATKQAQEAVKEAAGNMAKNLKLPFGSE